MSRAYRRPIILSSLSCPTRGLSTLCSRHLPGAVYFVARSGCPVVAGAGDSSVFGCLRGARRPVSGGGLGQPLVDALPVRGEQPAADEDALREIGAAGDQGAKDVTGSGAYQVHGVRCL